MTSTEMVLTGLAIVVVLIVLFGIKDKSSDKPGTGVPEEPQRNPRERDTKGPLP